MMRIRHDQRSNEIPTPAVSFQPESVQMAVMKEKLTDQEAVVTIGQQDVRVRFVDGVPSDRSFMVRLVKQEGGTWVAQAVPLSSIGRFVPASLDDGIDLWLSARGIRLTEKEKEAVRRFWETEGGSIKQKQETVAALTAKQLEVTEIHLRLAHEALHGPPLGDLLAPLLTKTEEPEETDEAKAAPVREQTERWEGSRAYAAASELVLPPAETRTFVMTAVTEKMKELVHDFRVWQRDMARQLEQFAHAAAQKTPERAVPLVESLIHSLDRMLLNGDWLLFTDMKTETKLLEAGAKLAEAKRGLAEGKMDEAAKTVREVKALLESLRFQPSEQKVMRFFLESDERQGTKPHEQLSRILKQASQAARDNALSARGVVESLRRLGFFHEQEAAQALLSGERLPPVENLKSLLLSWVEEGTAPAQAERVLMNLTGQQLLNKFTVDSHTQTMLYQWPLSLHGEMATVHVHVNARSGNGQLDWQNCRLYFLLDTNQGKVGISLQAIERQLSVTVETESEKLAEVLQSYASTVKDHLEQIGYRVQRLAFQPMDTEDEERAATDRMKTENETSQWEWTI
ncbi:hypothetical protein MKY25_16275 [Geobacillus sp. FSL W8-0032]|uniref:Flagellar hook-length control protein FliK n=1 Tax=Geobacillus icigianus TaxID=1430331 RepID=A0ABU6BGI2_9BACL|nr:MULTISPECIES: hypothetical protein [Geobacillus]MEB3751026.1 hypothetical protein [Geobacillus icigianus]